MNKLAIERRVQYGAEKMLDVSRAGASSPTLTHAQLLSEL